MDTTTGDVAARDAAGSTGDPARACHDLLLALAGRVPDRALWRLRDWSARDATVAVRTALPRTLVRHRVGLTAAERALLRTAVLGWSGPPRLADAVLHLDEAPPPAVAFSAEGRRPGWDTVDLALLALAPEPGIREVRRAWRRGGAPTPTGEAAAPARVVLVHVEPDGPHPVALTGRLQRGLRVLGEPDPRVEVMGPGSARTPYHEAAVAGSELLWAADGRAGTSPAASASAPATGELVPRG